MSQINPKKFVHNTACIFSLTSRSVPLILYDTRVRTADGFRPDEIKKCGDETRDREQKSKRKEHNNAEKIRR